MIEIDIQTVGAKGIKEAGGGAAKAAAGAPDEDAGGDTYYDAMKAEMGGRAAKTRAAMDALDPGQRVAMEGHRPGAYLRLRFSGAFQQYTFQQLVK